MDNPIAAKQIETIVINSVIPMCERIGVKDALAKEIAMLTSELTGKESQHSASVKSEVDNFDAFMELLELSPLYNKLVEHTKYQRLSIQSFTSILKVSRDVANTAEFQKLFRMVGDRLNPKEE